jgi:glycosyltransferase involved in cell wall biosynthesis
MMYPDFSIIVPTFNRPAELADCLQALALLEYPQHRFEIIVVDDGGALPAAPIISRFQPDLEIISLRQDRGGPAAARNAGARIGRGRYLAFTDDDCLPAPGWLSALARRQPRWRPGTQCPRGKSLFGREPAYSGLRLCPL